MKDSTWAILRKLKDSTNKYLVGPLPSAADMTLLGKPVIIDASMPAVGAGNKSVVFGDLSAYYARMAGGIVFESSSDYAFNTALITYRAVMRADGALVDLNAVRHYVSA